jgi:short-subunit dehydrogenase
MGVLSTAKRILITGASQGIGKQAALSLARQGHSIVLAARNRSALQQLAAEIEAEGGRAEVQPMDLTDDDSVAAAIEQILSRAPIDVVVNNAGTCLQRPFLAQDPLRLREEMELNYWGAQRVTRAALPSMIARRQGSIVNVSSLLGFVPSPTTCNYCGTKAALNAWTHSLRGEVARLGIRVTVFVAPHTQTSLGAKTEFDGVTSLPVEYTVKELCRAIDRAPRLYAGSPVYRMLIRFAAWFPLFMERRLAASVERVLVRSVP